AINVSTLVVAIQPKNTIYFVVGHEHGEIESETDRTFFHRPVLINTFAGIEKYGKKVWAALAIWLSFTILLLRKEFVVRAMNGGIFSHSATMHLPLDASHTGDDLKM